MFPNVAKTSPALSRRQMRHQHRALACSERRPVPLDDADGALHHRHRPLAALRPIQRAHHRHFPAAVVLAYLVSAAVIIGAAVWLARTGEAITHAMGWEASFVGTQFLALSTSLPELAASFAAIRINAPELALGNLLGSNLFNMGFVLAMDDLVLVGSPLWSAISPVHAVTAVFAILMTSVVVIALVVRREERRKSFLTMESGVHIALYVVASAMVFALG